MLPIGSLASGFATAVGVVAGMIAIGGFLAHARPALDGAPERDIQQATVTGGLVGGGIGLFVVVLSAIFSKVIS
jgi:hypothetical protein